MGMQNQLKISGIATEPVSNQLANTSINSIQSSWNRPISTTNNFKPTICPNCRYAWPDSQRQNCPAWGKNCKNCGISNHFAKVFRKTKKPKKPKPQFNNFDKALSAAATIGTSATMEEQVNQTNALIRKHNMYDANYDSDYDNFDDNCVAVISDSDSLRQVEPINMHFHLGNTKTIALVDSGIVCTIINYHLANAVVLSITESYWTQTP